MTIAMGHAPPKYLLKRKIECEGSLHLHRRARHYRGGENPLTRGPKRGQPKQLVAADDLRLRHFPLLIDDDLHLNGATYVVCFGDRWIYWLHSPLRLALQLSN